MSCFQVIPFLSYLVQWGKGILSLRVVSGVYQYFPKQPCRLCLPQLIWSVEWFNLWAWGFDLQSLQGGDKLSLATCCSLRCHLPFASQRCLCPLHWAPALLPLQCSAPPWNWSPGIFGCHVVLVAPSSRVPVPGTGWVSLVNGPTHWQHPPTLGS